jgi:hypothetical protein
MSKHCSRYVTLIAAAALPVLISCDGHGPLTAPGDPEALVIAPPHGVPPGPPDDVGQPVGSIQIVTEVDFVVAGAELTLEALVTDRRGQPMPNRLVTWSSTNGGAVDPETAVTDADGRAWTTLTPATAAGTEHGIAATAGLQTDHHIITVLPGPPAALAKLSEDELAVTAGTVIYPEVLITDAFGNALALEGYAIDWEVLDLVSEVFDPTTYTNVAGTATVRWTLGTTAPEYQELRATAPALNDAQVRFRFMTVPDAPVSIEIDPDDVAMTGSEGTARQFHALVLDQYDNAIQNADIEWYVDTPVITLTPAGSNSVRATVNVDVHEDISTYLTASVNGRTAYANVEITAVP